ncbi:hypothetical protein C9F11_32250 [Streptomyces sp. YIM 121038]|nr:hypothetical protein C9F11_32250 [Streptomyces sp. YIM 121038]
MARPGHEIHSADLARAARGAPGPGQGPLRAATAGYPAAMTASDHPHRPFGRSSTSAPGQKATGLASPETALSDALAQVVHEAVRASLREAVRTELPSQLADAAREQRRRASLYAAAGVAALYAGAAAALTLGLAVAVGLPGWAAGLIVTVLLAAVAVVLRNAARPGRSRPGTGTPARAAAETPAAAVPPTPRGAPGTADFPAVPSSPPDATAPPVVPESPSASPRSR